MSCKNKSYAFNKDVQFINSCSLITHNSNRKTHAELEEAANYEMYTRKFIENIILPINEQEESMRTR